MSIVELSFPYEDTEREIRYRCIPADGSATLPALKDINLVIEIDLSTGALCSNRKFLGNGSEELEAGHWLLAEKHIEEICDQLEKQKTSMTYFVCMYIYTPIVDEYRKISEQQ